MAPTRADVDRMEAIIARMRRAGVVVVEVDGWRTRGRPQSFSPMRVFEHHDASSTRSGDAGALGVIVAGRPGVPGPLSQFQVSRSGRWFVVAAGRANHGGTGGPTRGIPKDSANRYAYGVEVANSGTGAESYSEALHRSLDLGFASILAVMGQGAEALLGHKEWARPAGRKNDPRHSMDWRRKRVAAVLAGNTPKPPPEEDDLMAMSDADWKRRIDQIGEESAERVWSTPQAIPGTKDPKTGKYQTQPASVRLTYANFAIYQVRGLVEGLTKKVADLAKLVADEGMSAAERKAHADQILAGVDKLLDEHMQDPEPPADPTAPSPGN